MSFYSGSVRTIMVHICTWDFLIVSVALGMSMSILYYSNRHIAFEGDKRL